MEKTSLVKEKKSVISVFLLDFLLTVVVFSTSAKWFQYIAFPNSLKTLINMLCCPQHKFSLWCFPLAPNGFNILRYYRGHSSDFVTLHLKNFHQSHSCMHIQERRIKTCVNYGGS